MPDKSHELILWLSDIKKEDIPLVGGKGANLGEMANSGFPIPPAFAVTAYAYKKFLDETGLKERIFPMLKGLDVEDSSKLQQIAEEIQVIIRETPMPDLISNAIIDAYRKMKLAGDKYKNLSEQALKLIQAGRDMPFVIARSSATAEDLPGASFAGQQKSIHFVKGDEDIVNAVQDCWSSLFTARAIFYREKNHFNHEKVLICVVVQKQIESEKSGVAFSIHPSSGDKTKIVIEAGWGIGDAIVGGEINPNLYVVDKQTLNIVDKEIKEQPWMYIRDFGNKRQLFKKPLSEQKAKSQVLTDSEIVKLATYVKNIEQHYGMPMDVEWAVEENHMYIVQARPVTFFGQEEKKPVNHEAEFNVLVKGLAAGPGTASGPVNIIHSAQEIDKIKKGDILVTEMTNPDFVPAMRRAAAIVTNEGGMTCHAAIVSRELGVPCIVGTLNGTTILKQNDVVTVDGSKGLVYSGGLQVVSPEHEEKPFEVQKTTYTQVPVTGTKVYMNLGIPEKAQEYSNLPCDGIGLMRIEFIIASYISEHPLSLIKQSRHQIYTEKLAEGIGKVARAFYPKPVVVRFSDFKTNEYKSLKGGQEFEPDEDNPMIGWRGCSRYISDDFEQAFRLECKAIKKVRDEMNLKNVWVMLPFVRNTWEVKRVLEIMAQEGLERKPEFKIWIMAEVPSVIFLAEEFSRLCDGFSIGSNDLTQLILGTDRDSAILGRMGYFDERNEAVIRAIKYLIKTAHESNVTVSICGQAPSIYPEFCEILINAGIDSISVNPDVVPKTKELVASIERKLLLRVAREEQEREGKKTGLEF